MSTQKAEVGKIILVTRRTRLEEMVARFNTRSQARFYIEQSAQHGQKPAGKSAKTAGAFELYEQEHERYLAATAVLRRSLQEIGKTQQVDRELLPNFMFRPEDLVVCIGVDGLVVNTAKYLRGQYLVAVNPDPTRIDGILLPFNVENAPGAVVQAVERSCRVREVSMAEVKLNNGQQLLAFNDLFIGARSHVSARYQIAWNGRVEQHSSSGLIISTGAGASGWLSSMFNMANGLFAAYDAQAGKVTPPRITWESDQLVFVVREPFISKTSQASLVSGAITPGRSLVLESRMAQGGVIFSDGVEQDFLEFNAGAIATVDLAATKTRLVVPGETH